MKVRIKVKVRRSSGRRELRTSISSVPLVSSVLTDETADVACIRYNTT